MDVSRYFKYPALYALAVGAFGIGSTEFVIMGLLQQVATDMHVSLQGAGFLISGYALGVVIGAPVFTWLSGRFSHKHTLLLMMLIFTLGNLVCWWAPNYELILGARILTAFAHGTFFGVGSVVATKVVPPSQKASAIAFMFSGLTLATILGVPAGAWLGQNFGWRIPFAVISVIGLLALIIIAWVLPETKKDLVLSGEASSLKRLLGLDIVLKLLTTVFAFAGFFVVFTYVQSMLTEISGFSLDAVSAGHRYRQYLWWKTGRSPPANRHHYYPRFIVSSIVAYTAFSAQSDIDRGISRLVRCRCICHCGPFANEYAQRCTGLAYDPSI
jgi:MFS transporter, DHA1 family, inner membrane transport protein